MSYNPLAYFGEENENFMNFSFKIYTIKCMHMEIIERNTKYTSPIL